MAIKRFDVQLAVQLPPAPAEVDARGTMPRGDADWTLRGNTWATLSRPTSTPIETGHQAGDSQTFTVAMTRNDSFSLDWRLKVLSGPYAGRFLYPQSIDFPDLRTMEVSAVMTRTT